VPALRRRLAREEADRVREALERSLNRLMA